MSVVLRFINTEVFRSNGYGCKGFSGITDILAISKLKFCIKKAQSNGFSRAVDKLAIPNWFITSENICILNWLKWLVKVIGWIKRSPPCMYTKHDDDFVYSLIKCQIWRRRYRFSSPPTTCSFNIWQCNWTSLSSAIYDRKGFWNMGGEIGSRRLVPPVAACPVKPPQPPSEWQNQEEAGNSFRCFRGKMQFIWRCKRDFFFLSS